MGRLSPCNLSIFVAGLGKGEPTIDRIQYAPLSPARKTYFTCFHSSFVFILSHLREETFGRERNRAPGSKPTVSNINNKNDLVVFPNSSTTGVGLIAGPQEQPLTRENRPWPIIHKSQFIRTYWVKSAENCSLIRLWCFFYCEKIIIMGESGSI